MLNGLFSKITEYFRMKFKIDISYNQKIDECFLGGEEWIRSKG